MKLFKLPNGEFTQHPTSRTAAVNARHRFYTTKTPCNVCKSSSLRFTSSDNCMMCQRYKIELVRHFANYSPGKHVQWPDHVPNIEDEKFIVDVRKAVLDLQENGLKVAYEPCKKHGHIMLTNHANCHYCDNIERPQQQAKIDGKSEYVGTTKCKGCGEFTLRKTCDGSCVQCGHNSAKGFVVAPSETTIMMRDNPDMIVTRNDAKSYGLKVYRTGNECKKGHKAFRYVTTGNCIDCIRG